jgi:CRISPR-associated endonuclease Cas2
VKIILNVLLVAGVMVIAASSPKFGSALSRALMKEIGRRQKLKGKDRLLREKEYPKEKIQSAFYYLRSKGLINIEYKGQQMYIALTDNGVKKAGKYRINDLEISKPKIWDKKWRILIFDISDKHRNKREALRGKLKQLKLFQLQKSVWVCPYEFQDVVNVLREFFGLTADEMKIIIGFEIENDTRARDYFKLN